MPKGTRVCKVCGAEYPYCRTERRAGINRWQDIACSPSCAAIYYQRVAEARAKKAPAQDLHTE